MRGTGGEERETQVGIVPLYYTHVCYDSSHVEWLKNDAQWLGLFGLNAAHVACPCNLPTDPGARRWGAECHACQLREEEKSTVRLSTYNWYSPKEGLRFWRLWLG